MLSYSLDNKYFELNCSRVARDININPSWTKRVNFDPIENVALYSNILFIPRLGQS